MADDVPMPQAVLLDLFDTLIYCPWAQLRQKMAVLVKVPVDVLLKGYAQTQAARNIGTFGDARRDLEEIFGAGHLDFDDEQITALLDFEREYLSHTGSYYPDVMPFVEAVRRAGLVVGVASNLSYGAATLVERLRVRELVDHVFLSYEVGHRKPEPEIYRHALKVMGVEAGETLLIDDQLRFCRGATDVGMSALLIRREVADRHEHVDRAYVTELVPDLLRRPELFMRG